MILPEELADAGEALRVARERWTREDLAAAVFKLRGVGFVVIAFAGYAFFMGWIVAGQRASQSVPALDFWQRFQIALRTVLNSSQLGFALLVFVIFAFIPWYQARKRRNELGRWNEARMREMIPSIRFETWLGWQRAPVTQIFLGLVGLVALGQIMIGVRTGGWGTLLTVFHSWGGVAEAGLVKDRYFAGEWWRLLTAPFLHGNIVHFGMNVSALAYLGKRLEVFARWPHLPLVFLFAACIGGEASAQMIPAPSVGASGGLMGWLGFLLVFETLHASLVPRTARRRLAVGVALTAFIGLIGFRFIDNAAHAGGLLAGIVYAGIVFPKSSSAIRPKSTLTDQVAGMLSFAVLAAASLFSVYRMFVG